MVARGADLNALQAPRGFTILQMAVTMCNLDTVELLVSHGADVNVSSKEGATSLMLAVADFAERTFGIKAKLACWFPKLRENFAERTFGIKAKHQNHHRVAHRDFAERTFGIKAKYHLV